MIVIFVGTLNSLPLLTWDGGDVTPHAAEDSKYGENDMCVDGCVHSAEPWTTLSMEKRGQKFDLR